MASSLPKTITNHLIKYSNANKRALQELKKVDPRDRYVVLYPNWEKVRPGIGFNLLNSEPAEKVFEEASQLLGKDILKLCLNGSREELMGPVNRAIAAFVVSHATMAKFGQEKPDAVRLCKAAGGIGVGFVNSLVFSEAMSFENGLNLVKKQAEAMEKSASVVPSARLKVRIRPATRIRRVCQAAQEHCVKMGIPAQIAVCSVVRRTVAHTVEIAGHVEAIDYLEENGMSLFDFQQMKRHEHDPQAFHTALMQPAHDYLQVYIKDRISKDPDYLRSPSTCSVYSATAGYRLRSLKAIENDLSEFPVKPLLVEQLIHCLFARPKELAQPNVIVLWDGALARTLSIVNRRAWSSSRLLRA